jgi:hypothetical protein
MVAADVPATPLSLEEMASLTKAIRDAKNFQKIQLFISAIFWPLSRFNNWACPQMDHPDPDLHPVDLGLLVKRLTACAARWFLQEGCSDAECVLPATGQSAKDLAFSTLTKFIKGEIKWQPNSEESANQEAYALLKRVMRHDFIDLVKPGREYKRTEVRDARREGKGDGPALEDMADDSLDILYSLEAAVVERQVYPLLEDAPELKEYIHAVLYGNCSKREDIATYLAITPQEVTNRHKRLRARLEPWKISMEKAGVSKGISHER